MALVAGSTLHFTIDCRSQEDHCADAGNSGSLLKIYLIAHFVLDLALIEVNGRIYVPFSEGRIEPFKNTACFMNTEVSIFYSGPCLLLLSTATASSNTLDRERHVTVPKHLLIQYINLLNDTFFCSVY